MAKKTPATTNAQTSKEPGLVKRFITYVEDSTRGTPQSNVALCC